MNKKTTLLIIVCLILITGIFKFNFHTPSIIVINNSKKIIRNGSNTEKIIALTFDDGPHPEYTNKILDILKEYNIKATFFVLGKYAELYPAIIKRQYNEGHEIGNHTYSHINIHKSTKENLQEEYYQTQAVITSLIDSPPKVFRPPYGAFNKDTLDILETDGLVTVLWSDRQDSNDWSNPDVETIINTTISNIKNGDIILFHDYIYYDESNTVEALKKILPKLKSMGYKFVTVSDMIN